MHAFITISVLALLLLVPAADAGAVIYSYKDANGRMVFVDDEQKIPPQYRDNTSAISEQRDAPAAPVGDEKGQAAPPAMQLPDRGTQLRARQQVEQFDRERASQTPVMIRGNRVLVPVEVGVGNRSAHLMLLLDTGATATVLHRSAVSDLVFPPGETVNATVAGGRSVKSEKVTLRYLDVGPYEMKDHPVMLITPQQGSNLPFDGMLGMDFLREHPYEVDYTNEILRWKSPR